RSRARATSPAYRRREHGQSVLPSAAPRCRLCVGQPPLGLLPLTRPGLRLPAGRVAALAVGDFAADSVAISHHASGVRPCTVAIGWHFTMLSLALHYRRPEMHIARRGHWQERMMQFVCDAPPKTWFRIETEGEATLESREMNHAVEKYFKQFY